MSTRISLGFSERTFAEALALKVCSAGVRPADAVEHLLIQILIGNLCETTALTLLKSPSVKLHSMYFKERCTSLNQLARNGYTTWYVELVFSTATEDAIESVEIEGKGLELKPVNYGPAGLMSYKFSSKKLKTQINHILRLNHVIIPPSAFSKAIYAIQNMPPLEQPFIANPRPGPRSNGFELGIEGFEFVSFDHIISGKRCFCSCARPAHESMVKATKSMASYAQNAWPHQVIRLLSDADYREGICHLCVAHSSGSEAASNLYGDAIHEFVAPYTDQLMLTHGIDKPTARSEVQQTLGVSRWVREAEMYNLVKRIFPEHVVHREGSPAWLGRQRLDIYIPDLNLALEHQGEQHYKAISAFGGEAAFQRNLERDVLKRRLCEENGVHLIEIRFDEPMTLPILHQRLRRFIPKQTNSKQRSNP